MHEAGIAFDQEAYCNFFLRILKDSNDTEQSSKLTFKLSEDMQVQAIRALGRLGEWAEHVEALLDCAGKFNLLSKTQMEHSHSRARTTFSKFVIQRC